MSTRSGKRIHRSYLVSSDITDDNLVVMSERKTKSTRMKEITQDISVTMFNSQKRNNYVSYPTDDELLVETGDVYSKDVQNRRLTRRTALKEQNIDISNTNSSIPLNNQLRVTRKTKKMSENCMQSEEHCKSPDKHVSVSAIQTRSKKDKTASEDERNDVEPLVGKKKTEKISKKQSDSLLSKLTTSGLDNFNMSKDSFLSVPKGHVDNKGTKNKCKQKNSKNNVTILYTRDDRSSTTKKDKKEAKEEVFATLFKDPTNDADMSPLENAGSFVFDSDTDWKGHKSCVDNKTSDDQVSDKETNGSTLIIQNAINNEKDIVDKSIIEKRLSKKTIKNMNDNSFDRLNMTFQKEEATSILSPGNKIKTIPTNATFKKDVEQTDKSSETMDVYSLNMSNEVSPNLNLTFEKHSNTPKESNLTPELDNNSKSSIISRSFDNEINYSQITTELVRQQNDSAMKITSRVSLRNSPKLNNTFELKSENEFATKSPNTSSSHENQTINLTFEKLANSSLISSDRSKCHDTSHITITSDESSYEDQNKTSEDVPFEESPDDSIPDSNTVSNFVPSNETILNTTPFLVESSSDEINRNIDKSLMKELVTPLKREGTFTKDGPEVFSPALPYSPKATPFQLASQPSSSFSTLTLGSPQKTLFPLNLTRSLEKRCRSSLVEQVPRSTRVMFCSPVNDTSLTNQKRTIIKSSLKGSSKSFIYKESESPVRGLPRKRSYTTNDADSSGVKRRRLPEDMQLSVDRLSRGRTCSATGKLNESTVTSKREATPFKAKVEGKVSRTKLPNFAALHKKEFDKMISLNECQERKAMRARQLLTPTAVNKTRSLLKESTAEGQKKVNRPPAMKETAKKFNFISKLPIPAGAAAAQKPPASTRFDYKLNLGVNPFSIPSASADTITEENNATAVTRATVMPSMAGATSVRRENAKQIVMREKSFTRKTNQQRNETRTIIKGVRTNRRFDLQMKLRNM